MKATGSWIISKAGMPIVATSVGGVPELVNDETGWPISDRSDPEPYVAALREAVSSSPVHDRKLAALAELIATERSWGHFEETLGESL